MAFSNSLAPGGPFGNFQSSSTAFQNGSLDARRPGANPRPPAIDLAALQGASRLIQDQLIKDAQIVPDLSEMLTIRTSIRY